MGILDGKGLSNSPSLTGGGILKKALNNDNLKTATSMENLDQLESQFRQENNESSSALKQQALQDTDSAFRKENRTLPGRELPVVGPILRGLDWVASNPVSEAIAEYTVPDQAMIRDGEVIPGTNARTNFLQNSGQVESSGAAKFAGQAIAPFFVPGAQIGTGSAASQVSQATLNRVAPRLQGLGRTAARESMTGGIIGAGSEFAQGEADPVQAVISGAIGAAGGAALPALGAGVRAASRTAGRGLTQAAERPSLGTAVQEFANRVNASPSPTSAGRIVTEVDSALPDTTRFSQAFEYNLPENVASRAENAREMFMQSMTQKYDPTNLGTDVTSMLNHNERKILKGFNDTLGIKEAPKTATPAARAEMAQTPPALPTAEPTAARAPRTTNRQLIENTFLGSEKLAPEVRGRLENSSVRQLEPITNKDTVDAATQRIGRGVDEAESFALNGKGNMSADQVATGFRLMDQFQRTGQIQRAVTMAERLAERLTEAGRTVQAASIWNRLTPEGALVAAQRKVSRINEELPKNAEKITISEKTANDITNAAGAIQRAGGSQERASQVIDIMDRLRAGEQISDAERSAVSEFIKDAQQFVKSNKTKVPRDVRTPREMSDKRVSDNVISFLEKQEQAAKDRLRSKGIQISSNPLDVWGEYAIIGATKLAKMGVKGAVKFNEWASEMVRDYGESIRPQLNDIYNKAQDYLATNSKRISEETISEAESIAERYLTKKGESLKPEDIDLVRNLAQKVSSLSGDAKRLANQDLQAALNSFDKAGIGKKLSAAQYIFMLLNPVTQVRNVVGNELLYRLERLNRWSAAPIDWANSKLTGKDRTITAVSGPMSWENFFAPTKDFVSGLKEGTRAGWRGVNPEGLTTQYDISGQAFRSKLNPMTYLEKTLGAVMKGFDYAAFNRATQQRLRETAHLDAINKGVKGRENIQRHIDRYMANLDDNIAAVAKEYGKFVTLQDNTMLSKALNSTKRGLNRLSTFGRTPDFGSGNLIIPFAKTPANLLMRAIDYSPAGIAKSIMQAHDVIRKPNTDLTRADVIQSVTRALLGTGLTGVGLWLADKGILRGESSSDRDVRELEKLAGLSQYQINATALQRVLGSMVSGNMKDVDAAGKPQPGDTFWQYEWAQPTSIPLALGANIIQERRQSAKDLLKKGESKGLLEQGYDVTTGALNTLFNTSVLQGLVQAFDFPPGEENKFRAFLQNLVKQVPNMAVPSIVNRINQVTDPAIRETYDKEFLQGAVNPALSRVPGVSQMFPQRVNTLGKPQTRENSFADTFLLPAQRSTYKPSAEAKTVIDLLSESGDERIAPRAVPRYITGTDPITKKSKRVDLNAEQFVKYQKIVGEETVNLLSKLPQNLTTEKKVERVVDILSKAGEKGRKEMRKELGLK